MDYGELVSRVSNQLKMISKDDYINNRLILSTAMTIGKKLLSQKLQQRSLNRNSSVYTEVSCIEFEKIDTFKCKHIEFRSCNKLSKSVNKFEDLIYTKYGSSIKELYTIDRSTIFTESTLYQLRNDSERQGYKDLDNKYYLLEGYIYIPDHIKTLSGLVLTTDPYELNENCDCEKNCQSIWEYEVAIPDNLLEDVISYTIQNLVMTKNIPEDERPNMNNNEK